jgi:hypothetical protein
MDAPTHIQTHATPANHAQRWQRLSQSHNARPHSARRHKRAAQHPQTQFKSDSSAAAGVHALNSLAVLLIQARSDT